MGTPKLNIAKHNKSRIRLPCSGEECGSIWELREAERIIYMVLIHTYGDLSLRTVIPLFQLFVAVWECSRTENPLLG